MEIQRLIGRALRAGIDTTLLGERTITIDCDVLQADGGTRTASISGAYVALVDAVNTLMAQGKIKQNPIHRGISSVSVGVYEGQVVTDLDYIEDSNAETDMNVVMDDDGGYIEIQGTAERAPFSRDVMNEMLDHAHAACQSLFQIQHDSLQDP